MLAVFEIALVSAGKRSFSSSVAESDGEEPMTESGSMSSAMNCVSEWRHPGR